MRFCNLRKRLGEREPGDGRAGETGLFRCAFLPEAASPLYFHKSGRDDYTNHLSPAPSESCFSQAILSSHRAVCLPLPGRQHPHALATAPGARRTPAHTPWPPQASPNIATCQPISICHLF